MIPTTSSADARRFNWLLANFVHNTDGVTDAVAVSSDGLLMAASDGLDRDSADQLSAIVAGMTGLARGASRRFGFAAQPLIFTSISSTEEQLYWRLTIKQIMGD